ncbi:MAG: type II toxin-antitoxin system RelE/ParE family toxin [Nitrospirae bacterium]|nr:type II toxin-antitoxin system RelE/ParE family toxin [Nitrospirota bacterium]
MNRYSVDWSLSAADDLEAIIEYISDESRAAAIELLGRIRGKASGLTLMPERGRIVPELKAQGIIMYREIMVSPWRIIYRISGRAVYVFAVIDSRRNVEDLLLERLTR